MKWSCLRNRFTQEVFATHATHSNAALTPRAWLRLARFIVNQGAPPPRVAERYDVSWKTAAEWAVRYRHERPAGMLDRCSAPHRQANRTQAGVVRQIGRLRLKHHLGPVQIADRLGIQASTGHAVLVRSRLNRLTHPDRPNGERIRRYERDRPGDLIHVDVKKLSKAPDGDGWRYLGRTQGVQVGPRPRPAPAPPRASTGSRSSDLLPAHRPRRPLPGRPRRGRRRRDQADPAAVLRNAVAWFSDRGVHVRRVFIDNGGAVRSYLWRDTCLELGITPKRPRPYRPQTNGKNEGFHHTLVDVWVVEKFYDSETTPPGCAAMMAARVQPPPTHSAIGKVAPRQVGQRGWTSQR